MHQEPYRVLFGNGIQKIKCANTLEEWAFFNSVLKNYLHHNILQTEFKMEFLHYYRQENNICHYAYSNAALADALIHPAEWNFVVNRKTIVDFMIHKYSAFIPSKYLIHNFFDLRYDCIGNSWSMNGIIYTVTPLDKIDPHPIYIAECRKIPQIQPTLQEFLPPDQFNQRNCQNFLLAMKKLITFDEWEKKQQKESD